MAAPVQFDAPSVSEDVESIMLQLHEIGAIKFGEFKLKSGVMSPIYGLCFAFSSFTSILSPWPFISIRYVDLSSGSSYDRVASVTAAVSVERHVEPAGGGRCAVRRGLRCAIHGAAHRHGDEPAAPEAHGDAPQGGMLSHSRAQTAKLNSCL